MQLVGITVQVMNFQMYGFIIILKMAHQLIPTVEDVTIILHFLGSMMLGFMMEKLN